MGETHEGATPHTAAPPPSPAAPDAPAAVDAPAPPPTAPPPTADAPEPDVWAKVLKAISAFGPPITIGAALLLYFGWARSDAQARAMGLDVSMFGYSAQDYMLRSISSLFVPLVVLFVLAIAWLVGDRALRRMLDAGRHVRAIRTVALIAVVAGIVVALALAVGAFASPPVPPLYGPYLMALAVLVATWGSRLARAARHPGGAPSQGRVLETTLVACLVTLLLFWGTAEFAQARGQQLVQSLERGVDSLPRGILYSATPLSIAAPGVEEESVGTEESPLYRYTGLRLLVVSGGRVFFVHDGWTRAQGHVVVIPDDDSVRFEFQN